MLTLPLIIGGNEIFRDTSDWGSPFYPGYRYQVAKAGPLEVAAAIGSARRGIHSAHLASLEERSAGLNRAAELFTWDIPVLEHTVRMTGMPITQINTLLEDIPKWFREIPKILNSRFERFQSRENLDSQMLASGLLELLAPASGFCYVVTPGNDPRSAALAAANLAYLGIPFVLRASRKDAVAPLVVRALLAAGFDPMACSLVYFDPVSQPDLHFRLLDAGRSVWTFGPEQRIDETLRFERARRRAIIELPPGDDNPSSGFIAQLVGRGEFQVEEDRRDGFAGKVVLRHEAGNCAAILRGPLCPDGMKNLLSAILYPPGCTATRSAWFVNAGDPFLELAELFAELKVGDPLEASTQVGYIEAETLDRLAALCKIAKGHLRLAGGERLSAIQARPLLVAGGRRGQPADPGAAGEGLLAEEIPAYVLTLHSCEDLAAAVEGLNLFSGGKNRLAVSFYNFPKSEWAGEIARLKAWTVLIDQPTTRVIPVFHEGNDYSIQLRQPRLLVL